MTMGLRIAGAAAALLAGTVSTGSTVLAATTTPTSVAVSQGVPADHWRHGDGHDHDRGDWDHRDRDHGWRHDGWWGGDWRD
jgi:hypothetical protein